eukprot:31277-Pelagococcus_subviridis.AAC.6
MGDMMSRSKCCECRSTSCVNPFSFPGIAAAMSHESHRCPTPLSTTELRVEGPHEATNVGVELKGVRGGVERRRGVLSGLKPRGDGWRDAPGENLLTDRRSPRRRGRTGTIGVDERLLAHLAVLPVVLALTPRHPQVFQHDAKHVRQEPVAVIRRVRLAHVLHRPRVDRGDAPRTERVHDADGVAVVVLVPVEHRGWHPDRVADRLLQRVQEHLVL